MSRVEALWLRMAAIYPHSWTSALGDNPSGIAADTWASALAGITAEQLAEGLRSCVAEGREFPPSAGRFRGMCLGIPSFAAVKAELLSRDRKRSPFVLLVWRYVDAYAIRKADTQAGDRMLMAAYELAREKVMRGEAMPDQPAGEIAQERQGKPKPCDPAAVAEKLAAVIEEIGPVETRHRPDDAPTGGKTAKPADIERQLHEHYASIGRPVDPRAESAGEVL